MTAERRRLPNRRASTSFTFRVGRLAYTCTYSQLGGQVLEVFIQNHRTNSDADVNARDSAIAASLALQFGCPLETLRRALCRDTSGNASGPLGRALDSIAERIP
jgi:ribonucleoside-diphosphate reductase alpha chain